MLRVIVLGTAAGGGIPQWNCNCSVCNAARTTNPELRSTQASLAVSGDGENWFLINASPDLRQQITETEALHPMHGLRQSPIAGVILTNGEVDAVAGLLSLREGWPFTIYGHERVLSVLDENPIFNVLNPALVKQEQIIVGETFTPLLQDGSPSGLAVTSFSAPGKIAWYREDASLANGGDTAEGDTIGLDIRSADGAQRFVFLAACAELTPAVGEIMRDAPLVFFDGTLWRDDEMITQGLSQKTGRRMGHMSMSGEDGSIAALKDLGVGQKVFLHINNSNPAILPNSAERNELEGAGWIVPRDGMEISL